MQVWSPKNLMAAANGWLAHSFIYYSMMSIVYCGVYLAQKVQSRKQNTDMDPLSQIDASLDSWVTIGLGMALVVTCLHTIQLMILF